MRVRLNGRAVTLAPDRLIQSGGEGLVFGLGDTAAKLYHRPSPDRADRLRYWLDSGLAARLPANVLGPRALALADDGRVVGFQMGRLPAGSQPARQLANPRYRAAAAVPTSPVLAFLLHAHRTLERLHDLGLVVGDLNDHNLFFQPDGAEPASLWVDVDSYQAGGYGCPVAQVAFLDPALYGVADLGQRPSFTPLTDWYAYFTLVIKSLLLVHPCGGVHRACQSLPARAAAGITILDPAVTRPATARPPECLTDELLHELRRVYGQGQRDRFQAGWLEAFGAALTTCRQCGLDYWSGRRVCPACRQRTPGAPPAVSRGRLAIHRLLAVDGLIVHLAVRPGGDVTAVVRCGDEYRLARAGLAGRSHQTPLFSGGPGYRFALFGDQLVANPAGSRRLLILDVSGPRPARLAMLATAAFAGAAVFAAGPGCLYRLAGGALLCGRMARGHLLEAAVAEVRREQSQVWASTQNDLVAGCHRFYDQRTFFVLDGRGRLYDVPWSAPPGEVVQEVEVVFGEAAVAFLLRNTRAGRSIFRALLVGLDGRLLADFEHDMAEADHFATLAGKALVQTALVHPTDGGLLAENASEVTLLANVVGYVNHSHALHVHPAGLVVQQPSAVYLVSPA